MTLLLDTLTLKVPQDLEQAKSERLAIALFDAQMLTSGQAAEMAELSLSGFLTILSNYGVSALHYSAEEAIAEASSQ